jgi:murein DD-endopeptidase MepM/ murein hydrolase activator NlpD
MFQPSAVTEHEIRITTGDAPPSSQATKDISLVATATDSFVVQVPPASDVWAFAQVFQENEEERLDSFEDLGSSYAVDERKVTAALPAFTFTDQRPMTAKSFAAIVKLAAIPVFPPEDALVARTPRSIVRQGLTGPRNCRLRLPLTLQSPLERLVGKRYRNDKDPHPITHKPAIHAGTDLAAADGTPVKAAMSGKVIEVGYQYNEKKKTGYGHYIIIQDGVHMTKYAHLEPNSIKFAVGRKITKRQTIASSGHSGGVTGPHLHLEYSICGEKLEPLMLIPGPFVGLYLGTYQSALENGGVRGELEILALADNHISVTTPETGTGSFEEDGSVFFAAFNRPSKSGSFTGVFNGNLQATKEVDAISGGGTWSGTAITKLGTTSARGEWSATRVYVPK